MFIFPLNVLREAFVRSTAWDILRQLRRCGIIPRITICIVPENDGDRWINISFISKSLSPARFAYKESYKHVNMDSNTIYINMKVF
jgi:hypothetical protein